MNPDLNMEYENQLKKLLNLKYINKAIFFLTLILSESILPLKDNEVADWRFLLLHSREIRLMKWKFQLLEIESLLIKKEK